MSAHAVPKGRLVVVLLAGFVTALLVVLLSGCSIGLRLDLARGSGQAPPAAPTSSSLGGLLLDYREALASHCAAGTLPELACATHRRYLSELMDAVADEERRVSAGRLAMLVDSVEDTRARTRLGDIVLRILRRLRH